ncbi:MAG: sigma-70 family RNA polymerase sigma factor [Clostridium sp.]|uniref:sigma-70 family RNA polymerase sigma factor n=1 Tax=Clostridium sp. TaxID=1506 RepID=UPI0028FEF348|nr:sigma-70 family RNA polymerase sigma factor [Clostridium sp.]MDU1601572.1 sigma-70 family RNA polymerase sigma factor [Clostridium sp.]
MNYDYIENLVRLSKSEDDYSKEKLAEEFKPFIINISKRTFIHGYEFEDIMNECYKILFRCISLYKIETHRFVAYATNGIKNNINDLIRKNIKSSKVCGHSTIPLDNYVEETLKADIPEISDLLCNNYNNECLKYAIKQLTLDELNLVNYLFYKNNTLKSYASKNQISYSFAFKKKKYTLDKLFMYINIYKTVHKK